MLKTIPGLRAALVMLLLIWILLWSVWWFFRPIDQTNRTNYLYFTIWFLQFLDLNCWLLLLAGWVRSCKRCSKRFLVPPSSTANDTVLPISLHYSMRWPRYNYHVIFVENIKETREPERCMRSTLTQMIELLLHEFTDDWFWELGYHRIKNKIKASNWTG